GRVLGTFDHIAPEQVESPRSVGTGADLYALGCTLYFLLTGRPPFPGGSAVEKMLRHLREEPNSLEAIRPGVPPGLGNVVRRLMAKRLEDRFQTAAEVVDILGNFCVA